MNIGIFAMKNRLITSIVILAALFGGWNAYKNMPRFEDPEFTIRTAVVITQYPGATPEEVANEVTEPLETAIQQLQEVDDIFSTSSAGLSRIEVDIKYEFSPTYGTNIEIPPKPKESDFPPNRNGKGEYLNALRQWEEKYGIYDSDTDQS